MEFCVMKDLEREGKYKTKYPEGERPTVLPLGYITDRTQSVIWNEEQVQASKRALSAYHAKRTKAENKAYALFRKDLVECIKEGLSEGGKVPTNAQVSIIISKAYEDGHSYGYYQVIQEAEDLSNLLYEYQTAASVLDEDEEESENEEDLD